MKNKAILTTIFLYLITASTALAANKFTYEIAGITITNKTTAAELIMYFFNIGIAVGGFIAVVMVITSGIDYLTSGGNPSKLEGAKKRMQNSALGVVILVGAFAILNNINPELLNIKISKLECSSGIVFNIKDGTRKCFADSEPSLPEFTESGDWMFEEGTVYKVYAYPQENYRGISAEIPFQGKIPPGTKSIAIIPDRNGLYLFDKPGYKISQTNFPVSVNSSIPNLGSLYYDEWTNSIDVHNKNEKLLYRAIGFTEPNYGGKCAYIIGSVPNMGTESQYYSPVIGNNTLSSLVVFRTDATNNEDIGAVSLCNNVNCDEGRPGTKICRILGKTGDIKKGNIYDPIPYGCGWGEGERVFALKISGNLGVVLRSTTGECAYWDIHSNELNSGNRVGQLSGTSVLPTGMGGSYPKEFVIYPVDMQ